MNTIVIFFSRADENYFGGSMKYVEATPRSQPDTSQS